LARAGRRTWLLNELPDGFTLIVFGESPVKASQDGPAYSVLSVGGDLTDSEGLLTQRYDGKPGTVYLIRPTSTWPRGGVRTMLPRSKRRLRTLLRK